MENVSLFQLCLTCGCDLHGTTQTVDGMCCNILAGDKSELSEAVLHIVVYIKNNKQNEHVSLQHLMVPACEMC